VTVTLTCHLNLNDLSTKKSAETADYWGFQNDSNNSGLVPDSTITYLSGLSRKDLWITF